MEPLSLSRMLCYDVGKDNHCYWGLSNFLMLDDAMFGKLLVASTNLKGNTPHSNTENQFALFTDQSQSSKPLSLLSGMVCCGVGKDNHCYWGLSTSLMLDEARFGKLLIASINLKGITSHSSNTHLHINLPSFSNKSQSSKPRTRLSLSWMVRYGVGKGGHCIWSLSKGLMLDKARFGKLLIASTNLKGITPHLNNLNQFLFFFPTQSQSSKPHTLLIVMNGVLWCR